MFVQSQPDLNNIKVNYDKSHDVLYVYFGEPRVSYEDETAPGVFVKYSEVDEVITGFIIVDYKKKRHNVLRKSIPVNINFSAINQMIH